MQSLRAGSAKFKVQGTKENALSLRLSRHLVHRSFLVPHSLGDGGSEGVSSKSDGGRSVEVNESDVAISGLSGNGCGESLLLRTGVLVCKTSFC